MTELNTTLYGTYGGPTTAERGWRTTEQEYFVQADFRWRRNVTLNAGLRYSLLGNYSEVNGYMGNLCAVDSSGKIVPNVSAFRFGVQANRVSGISIDVPLFQNDLNNFQPRFGADPRQGPRSWSRSLGRVHGSLFQRCSTLVC